VCSPLDNTTPQPPEATRRTVFDEDILFHGVGGEQKTMDLLPGLAAARCPLLVLAGRADPVRPLADAKDIAAALPERWRRFEVIDGAGHGTWRDRPDAAFEVLRRFIVEP